MTNTKYPFEQIEAEVAETLGQQMHDLASELFPICRSITGNGVRKTLNLINNHIPLEIHEIPSGTDVFDWTIPKEWNINDAYIENERGEKIVDFKNNNLHVVGYSLPINEEMTLEELDKNLYSIPQQPDAIPYVTSYYKERWGFCITDKQRKELKNEKYKVFIDSNLKDGSLTYGECLIPGKEKKEIFLSTYICHPSLANNELSGPVVTTYLAKWIMQKPRKYSYRIIFIPETIGSIAYLSKNYIEMKQNIIAGFNITCVGDERAYSFLPSKYGDTIADKVALCILNNKVPEYKHYSYLDRGSDERQYNSPGIDLPVISIMRSKYGEYPEYHTSLDNLSLITRKGLAGSYELHRLCIELIENNEKYIVNNLCEPQLGKRGLYPTLSNKSSSLFHRNLLNFLAYADGKNDLIDISEKANVPINGIYTLIDTLRESNLIISVD